MKLSDVLRPRTVCVSSLAASNSFRPDTESFERVSGNNFQLDKLVWRSILLDSTGRRRTEYGFLYSLDNNFQPDTQFAPRASDNSTRLHIVVRHQTLGDNMFLVHTAYTTSRMHWSPVNMFPLDTLGRT